MQSSEVAYGEMPSYTGNTPTKAATAQYTYSFDKWTPAIIPVSGAASYTATYRSSLRQYTVTFYTNGGKGTMAAQTVSAATPTTLCVNAFTREDYSFIGWNTKPDGKGTAYDDGASVTLSDNLTLYAQWEKIVVKIDPPENVSLNGKPASRTEIYCAPDAFVTAYGVRYDAFGRFLGIVIMKLTPGEVNEITVLRDGAEIIRFFAVDMEGVPVCSAMDAPEV